jgi:hypothetical protein
VGAGQSGGGVGRWGTESVYDCLILCETKVLGAITGLSNLRERMTPRGNPDVPCGLWC